ncbi:MAG: hypothetical protein EAZ70_07895 [Runella slithyformis]|jgi:hypothetical protein|nr:MAG: hypothetical protein EAY79_07440 [Runella slithyformis]TAF97101.1 MAG: hypothetical protein EAZ46_03165 [Runella sp.]TAG21583.1 MAG: hypothetical protein EAZ38_07735 [Cytophagales bacterium]TAG40846.1 MAG: hypothetical protein EAZ32_05125 [Cytophagia bacterium]TAE99538.1 MAG: hypothetical protein EAZ80_04775 [Runella slithyformis]
MSNLKDIETAIQKLSLKDVQELTFWFESYSASLWDDKIATDLNSGKLEKLLTKAKRDFLKGDFQEI